MIDRGMLWAAALEDLGRRCSVDTALDAEYVRRRVMAEGDEFFTTSLPAFGKDLELALEDRCISMDLFEGFKRRSRFIQILTPIKGEDGEYTDSQTRKLKYGVPQFLQGFLLQIFDDSYDVDCTEIRELEDVVATKNGSVHENIVLGIGGVHYTLDQQVVPVARFVSDDEDAMLKIADAIAAVRQLCLMFGKEKSVCSDLNVERAVADFVQTDKELINPFSTEG